MRIHSRSPGKLILSGEHAVVHGCPALAMAVTAGVEVILEPIEPPLLRFQLQDRAPVNVPLKDLPKRLSQTRKRYQQVLDGHASISDVLDSPEDLLSVTAALAEPTSGAELRFHSQLPLGSGLGSSAACILALLKALQPEWNNSRLFQTAVRAEAFQHGRSSGIDVAASLRGGLLHVSGSNFNSLTPDHPLPAFRVYNSGRPLNSTGECVAEVAKSFPSSDSVWSDFREITENTLTYLLNGDANGWRACVRENHQLLCRIGVVPPAVQEYISTLERDGFAAKICGAGSLRGESAGMILVCGDANPPVPGGWKEMDLRLSEQGTRLIQEKP